MSEKLKTHRPIRSFADLPREGIATVDITPSAKNYVPWDATGMALTVLGKSVAVETLMDWLRARLAELNREKVSIDDITIVSTGGRTVVRVLGRDRFEFKVKCFMEERR